MIANKEPLIGVNVTVKDAPGLGTITDIDGRYRIEIDAYSTLLFSYIGFDTYKVLIKEKHESGKCPDEGIFE